MFITFEGIEGSGKSLQIKAAESYLKTKGIPCIFTREPGGTGFGISLRQVLLDAHGAPRESLSELLLYLADRYQHLKEKIEPSLAQGMVVISDRYHDATRAYQGAARGVSPEKIEKLAILLGIPEPDGTILLDLDPEIALARARKRNLDNSCAADEGRFENEEISFHRRVREGYLELARCYPERIRIISGSGSPEEVFSRIKTVLDEWLNLNTKKNPSAC